jgi:hypothetical protein
MKIDLLGKNQKQPGDLLYYTCIEKLDLKGYIVKFK